MNRAAALGLVLCLLLVALPTAAPLHATERPADLQTAGRIWMSLEATGSASGAGEGRDSGRTGTWTHSWSYAWGGTVEMWPVEDGLYRGNAYLSGGGTGSSVGHYEHLTDGRVTSTSTTTCALSRDLAGKPLHGTYPVFGALDAEAGTLVVYVNGVSMAHMPDKHCAQTHSSGERYDTTPWPYPSLSPLVADAFARSAAWARALDPTGEHQISEDDLTMGLTFEIPLTDERHLLFGRTEGDVPSRETASERYCPNPETPVVGTCAASGSLDVRALVHPCPPARASRDHHLAEVEALTPPPSGSSESQVRAFAVDVRHKVQALLADERLLALLCDEGDSARSNAALSRALDLVVEAWADAARHHRLSDDAMREFLSSERQRQLLGSDAPTPPELEAFVARGAAPASGTITVTVHSPVALHAWTPDGRHVGWDAEAGAPELGIDGATYAGEPGGAQTLTLPAGLYKLTADELGRGGYSLNVSWEGDAGVGAEVLPLGALAGRTMTTNLLLDEAGLFSGRAQRVATGGDFRFVDPPSAALAAPAGGGAAASDGEQKGAPGPAPALVALAAALLALVVRRRLL